MAKFFLSLHVLAAVVSIGPVTVAASMFPKALRRAHSEPGAVELLTTLRMLHRICRAYAVFGLAVPVFGFATASSLGVLGNAWLITSIVLTAVAAGVLALLILPTQEEALTAAEESGAGFPVPGDGIFLREVGSPEPGSGTGSRVPGRLAMLTGVFNLLWATVTVLMIIRPGSTTGV
ncbi:hypothetical protein [Actinomadura geliboluensis]|uniref:DUF2269 family protein n=1 Tax=Actinomadura geliboluensis TaxID=882440 RepID=A0A5S4HBI4_9ACTN|nr:hypothetical protein [Actinomadura geliboluensis]TMR42339.1 hypothetical protein ETD96_01275 [Actinomadura geliboluensis]